MTERRPSSDKRYTRRQFLRAAIIGPLLGAAAAIVAAEADKRWWHILFKPKPLAPPKAPIAPTPPVSPGIQKEGDKVFAPTIGDEKPQAQATSVPPSPTSQPEATTETQEPPPFFKELQKLVLKKRIERRNDPKRREKEKGFPPYERRINENLNADRINIVIIGIDKRKDSDVKLADAIVVLSLNLNTNIVNSLRIPRDLHSPEADIIAKEAAKTKPWVSTKDPRQINSITTLGDLEQARMTVEDVTGLSADLCLQFDFDAFKNLVDSVGGIDINVTQTIHDDKYPTEDYGFQTVHFDPGLQHMDGETALKYSRVRHGSTDYIRGNQQIDVAKALAKKADENYKKNPLSAVNFALTLVKLNLSRNLSFAGIGPDELLTIVKDILPKAKSLDFPEIRSSDPWTKELVSGQRLPDPALAYQTYIGDPKATGTPPPDPEDPLVYWTPVRNWVQSNFR